MIGAVAGPLVPTSEAARRLGLSARSLSRWAQDGHVEPDLVTPGGHMRWDVERLREQIVALRRHDD